MANTACAFPWKSGIIDLIPQLGLTCACGFPLCCGQRELKLHVFTVHFKLYLGWEWKVGGTLDFWSACFKSRMYTYGVTSWDKGEVLILCCVRPLVCALESLRACWARSAWLRSHFQWQSAAVCEYLSLPLLRTKASNGCTLQAGGICLLTSLL